MSMPWSWFISSMPSALVYQSMASLVSLTFSTTWPTRAILAMTFPPGEFVPAYPLLPLGAILVRPGLLPQPEPLHLARRCLGQVVHEIDPAGVLVAGQPFLAVLQ